MQSFGDRRSLLLEELLNNAYSLRATVCSGVLTSQGMTANITSRNIALKRCILVEMIGSQPTPVPAALPPFLSLTGAVSSDTEGFL